MLERYEQYVAPAVLLADAAALERIGQRLELTVPKGPAYGGPTLVVAGRQDSCCRVRRGYRPAQTLPARVLDGAGHALPHELAELLAELLQDWLARTGPDPSPT